LSVDRACPLKCDTTRFLSTKEHPGFIALQVMSAEAEAGSRSDSGLVTAVQPQEVMNVDRLDDALSNGLPSRLL